MNKIRTSRDLEKECKRTIEVMWLMRSLNRSSSILLTLIKSWRNIAKHWPRRMAMCGYLKTHRIKLSSDIVLGKYQLVVSDKIWKTLKQSRKTITRKTTPLSFSACMRQLKITQLGWLNYFRLASIQVKLGGIDGWVRNRLRYCIWHDWNRVKRAHEHR